MKKVKRQLFQNWIQVFFYEETTIYNENPRDYSSGFVMRMKMFLKLKEETKYLGNHFL